MKYTLILLILLPFMAMGQNFTASAGYGIRSKSWTGKANFSSELSVRYYQRIGKKVNFIFGYSHNYMNHVPRTNSLGRTNDYSRYDFNSIYYGVSSPVVNRSIYLSLRCMIGAAVMNRVYNYEYVGDKRLAKSSIYEEANTYAILCAGVSFGKKVSDHFTAGASFDIYWNVSAENTLYTPGLFVSYNFKNL
jgi:hypothetical protein